MNERRSIAYFCMEIGLRPEIPTYAGGLGVLAGDTLRAAADLGLPLVAVTLLHREGYFRQFLDATGSQREEPVRWTAQNFLQPTSVRATVKIEGRDVAIQAWKLDLQGIADPGGVPVYFLDSFIDDNSEWDRTLTHRLYGGDQYYRLCQEVVLGIGGLRILRALGYHDLQCFHMNEGHASLLALELLDERLRDKSADEPSDDDLEAVRRRCVFTTHTPVPAGHDAFSNELAARVLEPRAIALLGKMSLLDKGLNITHLAMKLSHHVNAVSERHGEVSRKLFEPYPVDAITNGVHAATWVAPELSELFDVYVPGWRRDALNLRNALRIPKHELWAGHESAKGRLLQHVNRTTNVAMNPEAFTIGFARRAATYKRADVLFDNLERLKGIHRDIGPIQLIYAGKAHPSDQSAKDLIRRIFQAKEALRESIPITYLSDYDMHTCALMTAGVDLWLNNPKPPLEASGTSGMKAALNGVPSLSVLDGWWVEGCVEGVTGWAIGGDHPESEALNTPAATAANIYDKLQYIILPMFYRERDRFVEVMRHAIAINGPHFSARRMMLQYATRMYFPV